MGLFRSLTVLLVGFFAIMLLNKNKALVKNIPILGPYIDKNVDAYRAEIIIALIAIVFLFI
tara:strand:- start:436 stop:618 length:183 start_codon:yes stop_codon:yes gene_type:complete